MKGILLLIVFVLCMAQCSCTIVEAAREHHALPLGGPIWLEYEDKGVWIRYKVTRPRRGRRPAACRHLYGNGTEDWINCMGVGYVR